MSPDILDGLSKRLTTAEMKGIIILTERGRKLEARASSLQAEKEDLYARLQVSKKDDIAARGSLHLRKWSIEVCVRCFRVAIGD